MSFLKRIRNWLAWVKWKRLRTALDVRRWFAPAVLRGFGWKKADCTGKLRPSGGVSRIWSFLSETLKQEDQKSYKLILGARWPDLSFRHKFGEKFYQSGGVFDFKVMHNALLLQPNHPCDCIFWYTFQQITFLWFLFDASLGLSQLYPIRPAATMHKK